MKKIKLTKNKYALVDDDKFEVLSKYQWSFDGNYAMRTVRTGFPKKNKWKTIYMHREVLSTLKNLGRYEDIVDAAKAYNKAALKYFGEFARLNVVSMT